MARPLVFHISLKVFSSYNFFLHFREAYYIKLCLQLASEVKGTELQCPVNVPSKMLIEGDRAYFGLIFPRPYYAVKQLDYTLLAPSWRPHCSKNLTFHLKPFVV